MIAGIDAWNAHQVAMEERGRDRVLLEHAIANIPFYQRLAPPAGGWTRLEQLPIVTRHDVAVKPTAFVAQGTGTQFAAKTSGTTGTPLTAIFDSAGWYVLNQELYAHVFTAIPELEGTFRAGRLAVTLVCNELNRPNTGTLLMPLDGALFHRRVLGRGRASDDAVIDELIASDCPLLYGKAAYLRDLVRAEQARGASTRLRPRALLTSGEKLFEDDRARFEDWFGCRLYDAYTSIEGGMMAIGCPETRALHVVSELVTLGIFNGREVEPTGDGELVLTNSFNLAMPFIRYRTGDSGVLADRCSCGHAGPTLLEIRGREAAWFDVAGRRVRASSLDRELVRPEVEQFELVQLGRDRFRLSWVAAAGADGTAVHDAIEQRLAVALPGAVVEVAQVPVLVKPGAKARRYAVATALPPAPWQGDLGHEVVRWQPPGAIAFCPPDGDLVIADANGTRILDVRGRQTTWAPPRAAAPTAVAVSADGARIGVAYADGVVRLGSRGGRPIDVAGPAGGISAIAISPAGNLIATAGGDGVVRLLDHATGEVVDTLAWHGVPVSGVTFAPDAETLATCDASGRIALWDMTSTDELPLLRAGGSPTAQVAFSPTSKFLAACVEGEGVVIWHLASGKVVSVLDAITGRSARFAYTGDGAAIVTAGPAGTLEVRDLVADRTAPTLSVGDSPIEMIAGAPTSARLRVAAAGCLDGTLHMYLNTRDSSEEGYD